MGVFLGVLRSGTIEEVRARLHGIDIDLSDLLALPGAPADVVTPLAAPQETGGVTAQGYNGWDHKGDVATFWRNGVPIECVQNSDPARRAWVPSGAWQAITDNMPSDTWENFVPIAFLESDFREDAVNPSSAEDSHGFLQVNRFAHPQYSVEILHTYQGCAAASRVIYDVQGYGAWYNSARAIGLPV